MDEVMAANDCKHRMAGFDYVIVMDMDEIIIPKPTRKNLHPTLVTALQEASVRHPKASAFSMDAHVVPPDWGKARESPLFLARFINRTSFTNYDGAMRNLRWAFSSVGVHHVRNNQVTVDKGYTAAEMPEDLYTFYHYRRCKNTWKNCTKLAEKIHDESILRYETKLVDAILALPVDDILSKEKAYVSGLKKWKKTESKRST
ncbi:uncharacterized protein LOC101862960 [Aplysia californica]|uniref:Glycosyltransferase family 92 protein n=1 Tax=Aplysia californica TaxID=6500 RepID=A0ABM1A4J6_APLCA|nr:uncharacterized protein LOC101862960 [Aplysia californica]